MKKNLAFALLFIFYSGSAAAMDLSQYKERLRSPMAKMLGEEVAAKLLGPAPTPALELPLIPQVSMDATSLDIYQNKNAELQAQGDAYNKLSLEEKRRYRVAFIQELYKVTRNSEPKESDVVKFLNVLEQGGSREGVYRAITLDSVYASLEAYDEAPGKALEEFAVYFGEKYLARRFDRGAIGQSNLWSIKRIITEKALEVMDVMAQKPNELRTWYAIFSAELARDYPSVWKNKVRQNVSEQYHLKWAEESPFQHIKSETIIKLHALMNHLSNGQ